MDKADVIYGGILFFVFLCIIALVLIATKVEQNTFNKFSKTKATFIEAMFTNLRIIPD